MQLTHLESSDITGSFFFTYYESYDPCLGDSGTPAYGAVYSLVSFIPIKLIVDLSYSSCFSM